MEIKNADTPFLKDKNITARDYETDYTLVP
jgi:hypothetical protein